MKIIKSKFPQASVLKVTDYDYYDSFKTLVNDSKNDINSTHVAKAFMRSAPNWVDGLFTIRNKIVGVFGLKTGPQITNKEEALQNFDGTLILVSHDRDFLQGLAEKVFEFKNHRVIEHFETIDDFLERNRLEHLKELDL